MSGYRHSGLTQEEYENREVLRKAADIVLNGWPDLAAELEKIASNIGNR